MVKKHTVISILLCLCSAVWLPIQAAPKTQQYQFEIIIFRQSQAPGLESWPDYPPQRFFSNHPAATPANLLPKTSYLLNKTTELIESRHPILLHLAWQESLLTNGAIKTVHIAGGKLYNAQGEWMEDSDVDTADIRDENIYPSISGDISVRLKHYFEVKTQLQWLTPKPIIDDKAYTTTPPLFAVHISQFRRMRSNQLNYMDHPLLGVIMKITPLPEIASHSHSIP